MNESNASTAPVQPETKPDSECKQHLRYRFTNAEKTELAIEQAEKLREVTSLEGEKKRIASQYKSRIDNIESEIEQLGESITTGYEMRMVPCDVYYDLPLAGWKSYFRRDTGGFVRQEEMTESERQRMMDFQEQESAQKFPQKALTDGSESGETIDAEFEESEPEEQPREFLYFAWVTIKGTDAKARNQEGDFIVTSTAGEKMAVANLAYKQFGGSTRAVSKPEKVQGTEEETKKVFRSGGPEWTLWQIRLVTEDDGEAA